MLLPGGKPLQVHMLDISAGGFSVVASVNPRSQETCVALLTIPAMPYDSKTFEVQATIVHSTYSSIDSGFKIGLKFTKISPEAHAVITQFVNT